MGTRVDVDLEGREWSPGDDVAGAVVVAEGGAATATTVYLRYVARQPGARDRVLREAAVETLRRGPLETGERLPFRVALPADAAPSAGGGESRRAWSLDVKVTTDRGAVHASREVDVAGAPSAAPEGTRGRRQVRERLGYGGTWALAGAVLAGLSVYLIGAGILVALAGDASGGERWLLVGAGALTLVLGAILLRLTVPPRAPHLDLAVDFTDLPAGATVTGTLWNRAPGGPVELAAVCRRTTAVFGRLGETGPLGSWASQSTLAACPADVDAEAGEQRFAVDLPAQAQASRRGGLSTTTWWVVARVPSGGRRDPCVLALLDVGA